MNSKKRVMRALDFQTPDRIPTSYELFWPGFIAKRKRKREYQTSRILMTGMAVISS